MADSKQHNAVSPGAIIHFGVYDMEESGQDLKAAVCFGSLHFEHLARLGTLMYIYIYIYTDASMWNASSTSSYHLWT
jgi:hypothetical protein